MCRMKNEALPNGSLVADDQLAAAIAAAPYIHPKLPAAVFKGEVSGADGSPQITPDLRWLYELISPPLGTTIHRSRTYNSGRTSRN